MSALASVAGTVAVLTLFSVSDAGTSATSTTAPRPAAASEATAAGPALALLRRAIDAPATTGYQGVQTIWASGGGATASAVADVTHIPGSGTIVRLRGLAGGKGVGSAVLTPEASPRMAAGYAATGHEPVSLLAHNYLVSIAGDAVVAGRTADVLDARRPDGSLAGRFWLDHASGLMLRREVYDGAGATVLASSFASVTLTGAPSASRAGERPPLPPAGQTRAGSGSGELTAGQLAAICASGWACPRSLAGRLDLYDVRRLDDAAGPVLHLSYSDGLSTVSVFEQRGRLGPRALAGYAPQLCGGYSVYAHNSMDRTLTWAADGTVYTVVTDAPRDTVDALVPQLPHQQAADGLVARVDRGLHRLLSWLDPLS